MASPPAAMPDEPHDEEAPIVLGTLCYTDEPFVNPDASSSADTDSHGP
jgi:hypothetical protein